MGRTTVIASLLLAVSLLTAAASRDPFSFVALDGRRVDLARGPGQPALVLHFWATWCPSCVVEMGELVRETKACEPGRVRVVAVNVDESLETIERYWSKHDFDLEVVRDPAGEEWRRLGGRGLPFNAIQSEAGLRTLSGPRDAAAWRTELARLGCSRPRARDVGPDTRTNEALRRATETPRVNTAGLAFGTAKQESRLRPLA